MILAARARVCLLSTNPVCLALADALCTCHLDLQAYKLLREAAGVLATARKELLPALAACQAADCHEQLLAALEATALADAQVGRHLAR